jgi:hypothetical protein
MHWLWWLLQNYGLELQKQKKEDEKFNSAQDKEKN